MPTARPTLCLDSYMPDKSDAPMKVSTKRADGGDTRRQIAEAALDAFAEYGFDGASTRAIARRAGVNQGLITYYFQSKELLWREAASVVFAELRQRYEGAVIPADSPRAMRRALIVTLVEFLAERPALLRFMTEGGGREREERVRWLVDHHLSEVYATFAQEGTQAVHAAHEFYAIVGAAAVIFAVPAECRLLTGLDPNTTEAVAAHADYLAGLFCS